jgi:hypothetical protein
MCAQQPSLGRRPAPRYRKAGRLFWPTAKSRTGHFSRAPTWYGVRCIAPFYLLTVSRHPHHTAKPTAHIQRYDSGQPFKRGPLSASISSGGETITIQYGCAGMADVHRCLADEGRRCDFVSWVLAAARTPAPRLVNGAGSSCHVRVCSVVYRDNPRLVVGAPRLPLWAAGGFGFPLLA